MSRGYRTISIYGAMAALLGSAMPSMGRLLLPLPDVSHNAARPAVLRSGRPTDWRRRGRSGKRELERARRQHAQVKARREVRALVAAGAPIPADLFLDANVKRPAGYTARTFDDCLRRDQGLLIIDEAAPVTAEQWLRFGHGERFKPSDFRVAIAIKPL